MQDVAAEVARLSKQAAAHAAAGRKAESVLAWERVNALAPNNAAARLGLGAALLEAGRAQDARAWLGQAVAAHPGDTELLRLLARALNKARQGRAAAGALLTALAVAPRDPALHEDLAFTLYSEDAAAAALPYAAFAFDASPNLSTGALLISVLLDLGKTDQAWQVIVSAPEHGADRASMLVLQSLWLQTFGRGREALAAAREALRLAPGSDLARHQLGALLLLHGQLTAEAWSLYEGRAGLLAARSFPVDERRWRGEDVAGRTVLLHAEQGFGDTLQFIRFVPLVAARGARVIVAVQPALTRLLQGTPGAVAVVAGGGSLPGFDYYCPLLCVPGILGTTLDTVPPALPYRRASRPPPASDRVRVGLVWAGNPDFSDDRRRSIPPELLAPFASVHGVEFHCLQLERDGLPLPDMVDAMAGVKDFADTAERVAGLDLVIAVDTAVAHLAATMGKEVWLLSRLQGCWRWLLDREDTPWYPTMRIYRQERWNAWGPVLERVRADLVHFVERAKRCSPVEVG